MFQLNCSKLFIKEKDGSLEDKIILMYSLGCGLASSPPSHADMCPLILADKAQP